MDYDEEALEQVREGRLLINRYDEWLFEEFSPYLGQRVLEIGCGLGNQVLHLLDRELVVGIDLADSSVACVQQKFAEHSNVLAFTFSITDPRVLALDHYQFDTALSLNVFEHIEDDCLALQNTYHLLQPGGRLVLIVPAHMALYGTMDSSIGHYRRYTTAGLAQKLEGVGFRVLKQKYVNILGAMGWWFNGRVLRKHVPPSGQLKLLNQIMPLARGIERILPLHFGISLVSISEKPA